MYKPQTEFIKRNLNNKNKLINENQSINVL